MIRTGSLPFCFALVIALVGLSGCAGSGGGKKSSSKDAPQVWSPARPGSGPTVGMVGGRRITKRDVDSVLMAAPPSLREHYLEDEEQYKLLVERIVQQEALYLAAKRAGTELNPEFLKEAEAQRRQILLKHFYQNATRSLPAVPDSAVQRYYDTHASDLTMPGRTRVRHIQVATRAKAKEVVSRLKSAPWEQVCARYSTDKTTAKSGGVLGFVTTDTDQVPGLGKAPAIVAAAFTLKEGQTSEPLKSDRGWHVIRADEKTEAGLRPLAQVERQIRETLQNEQSEKFQVAWMDTLKRTYGVVVYDDSIKAALHPTLTPAMLFARAQAVERPTERIELFREVTTKYPDDKSAIQAAFMIGFTYAEELKDFPAARLAFEDFIRKYPKSELVTSAKWMLENMEHSAPPPGIGIPDSLLLETTPGVPNKP